MNSPLKESIELLATQLKQHDLKVTTAESCTGGGLSFWLTSIAGSSDWFERGFVTYSNRSKTELLEVKLETLEKYGAVSEEVAREMAEGALKHSHADISLAITGIAGPTGGSMEKPVGTVWFACAKRHSKTYGIMEMFPGDRESIRSQAIQKSLRILQAAIEE